MTDRAISEAISYALSNGIVMRHADSAQNLSVTHAPMTCNPSPVDECCYAEAIRLSPLLNTLLHRIAADHDYLRCVLRETADADPDFTGRLLSVLEKSSRAPGEGIELHIVRYDYFVHEEEEEQQKEASGNERKLRMVEMNCIAASFACLGTRIGHMHRYISQHPACLNRYEVGTLPHNDPMSGLTNAIYTAHREFRNLHHKSIVDLSLPVVVLMLVQPGETNTSDQDLLRFQLWTEHKVEMRPISLSQINEWGSLEYDCLSITSPYYAQRVCASVVYFRAGYTPADYPTEDEWSARHLIEKSNAAKCPSVAMQLVGTKKVQQVLDQKGQVEKFLQSPENVSAIRATFARQYSLSPTDPGADEAVAMAIRRPQHFVLKPQREGGGNNLYSEQMKRALESMSLQERSAYVLMERIRPVEVDNILIRDGKSQHALVVSELGAYGVHVATNGKQVLNENAGTLLRSKLADQDDGGVAAGVAVLDSPNLVNS